MPVKFSYEQIVEASQGDGLPAASANLQDDIIKSMLDSRRKTSSVPGVLS